MPYDSYMESQEIPIYREIGISKVQNLALKPWKKQGGNGCFIQLYGTEGLWGMYVIEVPGGGALNVEKHLFEKIMYVIEGRGTTEVWWDGEEKTSKQTFEWQKGSMFTVPVNTMHRIVNASSTPALILAGTSAPNIMNLMDDLGFVFNCPQTFKHRYDGSTDYFKPRRKTWRPIRCAASPCAAPICCPTSSIASCRSITAARRAIAASSRIWAATASINGSASTKRGAIPKRTRMAQRPVLICLQAARVTPTLGRPSSARIPSARASAKR